MLQIIEAPRIELDAEVDVELLALRRRANLSAELIRSLKPMSDRGGCSLAEIVLEIIR